MDPRIRKAVIAKIKETVSNTSEVRDILDRLESIVVSSNADFAFGISLGRIYNSFHYQTRRILKRDATLEEFNEFLDILQKNASAIRSALETK